ncbi:family 2A encapsulin nanocompartment cargo protein cysteine desulfurase [Rhodoferax sp. GW822-FHT02A01]|uniref:family 2A encapsulin nanocompartment cargo protein cysteine desulfurase n=1 Tax=Rhodoferax sp. GW822-FHT02A01 TaxID=3141537 RepID=UPI00315CC6CD
MTIQTPTSDLPGATPPAGLPDVATLTQLAGAFFAALPGEAPKLPSGAPNPPALGGVPAPTNVLPGGTSLGPLVREPQLAGTIAPGANVAPTTPQNVLSLGASTPSLLPHSAATNGLPDNAAIVPPAVDNRTGGQALGVPEGFAASLPAAPQSPSPLPGTPSTPYYFLGESSGYPSTLTEFSVPREDRVTAHSFGLPGADDLRALLSDNPRSAAPSSATPGSAVGGRPQQADAAHAAGPFYFLDQKRPPSGYAGRDPQVDPQARHPAFDVNAIRRDFPILQERVNGRPLAWFDNAATTHKPRQVIERISYFYEHENSNIHRAAHELAARATDAYESAREKVRAFLGASSVEEVIFVRGATEAINLVAKTWGVQNVLEGDEIIVSNLEHHANIVPWQQLAAQKGARIRVIPVDDSGQVLLDEYKKLLNDRTKIVAVTQVSNALGTVVPVKEIVELAHRAGAKALVDGAQSVSHMRVNVQDIGADFFVFSGHKIFGPTGIGVVYGKRELLDSMPPWQGGGNMIADVTFERTLFQPPPNKFEAGTGNIADAVGLGAAIDYVQRIGLENIARYEHDILEYATQLLRPIPGVRLVGTAQNKASVLSFVLKGYTTEEVGKELNREGIAVRSGHHCAQPILRRFGLEATVRPSLAFYNTCEEVDRFIAVVRRLSSARSH